MLKNTLLTQLIIATFLFFSHAQAEEKCEEKKKSTEKAEKKAEEKCDKEKCDEEECCRNSWATAEFLFWKIKNSPESVPLVIQAGSIVNSTLGAPGTRVVLGGKEIDTKWHSGGRFTLGSWTCSQCWGGEAVYFFLPNRSNRQIISSSGVFDSAFLRIPFFDVGTGQEAASSLSFPGVFQGTATLKLANRMQGAELNILRRLPAFCGMSLIAIGGFRFWNFRENLTFDTSSPFIIDPDVYETRDQFKTDNNFYGGQLGLQLDHMCDKFFANIKAKIALGTMRERVTINGNLTTNDFNGFGEVQTFSGGYFALPSNIGKHSQTRCAFIPEFNLNIGYWFLDWFRIDAGYTFMYVNDVLWAGDQIDRNLNVSQSVLYTGNTNATLVDPASPSSTLKTRSLWVQGVSIGLTLEF